MTTNEMLAVIEREVQLLDADNWHASAAVMREAAKHIRQRIAVVSAAQNASRIWADTDKWRSDDFAQAMDVLAVTLRVEATP